MANEKRLIELPIADAILILKEELKQRADGYTTYLANGGKGDPAEEVNLDALAMAISALELQIPKKPIFVDTRFRNHGKNIADGCSISKCYKCPNPKCSRHIFHVFDDDINCKHCGQALDWEEA